MMNLRDPDSNSSLNRPDNNNSSNLSSSLNSMCQFLHCLNKINLNNHRDHNKNLHRDSSNSFRLSLTSRDNSMSLHNSKFLQNSLLSLDNPDLRLWLNKQDLNLNSSLPSSQPSLNSLTRRGY